MIKRFIAAFHKASPHVKGESLWARAWRRFIRHRLAMAGLLFFGVLVILALLAPYVGRYPPNRIDLRNAFSPPTWEHWLGTDGVGRDVWSRVVYGGRVSIAVGVSAVSISVFIAIFLGSVSAYFGGWADLLIMRVIDIVMSIPPLVLIMALIAIVGPSLRNTILTIGFLGWPGMARLIRGQILALREQEFIMAARASGIPPYRIILRHLLPNAVAPLIVAGTLRMASAILMEAALSFLGIGVPPPTPSWGNMLQEAQTITVLESYPWLWVPPGIAIISCVLSINLIGDGLRDALDPRLIL